MRLDPFTWSPVIGWTGSGFTAVAFLFTLFWLLTDDPVLLEPWFRHFGAILLVLFPMAGAVAGARVVSLFGPLEPMRQSWLFLATAAAVQAISNAVRHVLGRDMVLNPLTALRGSETWMPALDEFGRLLGGVLFPAVLILGLALALRTYVRLGLLPRLKWFDFVALAATGLFLGHHLHNGFVWLGDPQVHLTPLLMLNLTVVPLHAVLFAVAILLRRAKLSLRHGLIERCWTAYAWASFLTCAGSLGITLNAQGLLPDKWMWTSWLLWHPAAALFALGPIYQLETMETALASATAARLRCRP